MTQARWEDRQLRTGTYTITWKGKDGRTHSAEAQGRDLSTSGVGFSCGRDLPVGAIVRVRALDGCFDRECEVIHCTGSGSVYDVGCEFREERTDDRPQEREAPAYTTFSGREPDYYETLQISRKADNQTIHRVFRIMATRFHPDNPETGDVEQFLRLKQAYTVLSDPALRAQYDATLEKDEDSGPLPIFGLKDFVTGVEAEANRRLGVLSLLYKQRQNNPERPELSLLELEKEMGFPREYLSFTLWYVRAKEMVTMADNSDFVLTAAGADFLESKAVGNEIASQLLNRGPAHFRPGAARRGGTRTAEERGPILLPGMLALPEPF
jgi:curved DNA-binding protein CbpA